MDLLLQSTIGEQHALSFALFCLGVAALFFVYRRSVTLLRRSDSSKDTCLKARLSEAHRKIEQINGADWVARHRAALRIPRRGALPPQTSYAHLAHLSALQRQRGLP
jgi:hypothetical protein